MGRFSHVWHCVWLREVPNGVSPLLASFVRQSETLLVDVTLSVRKKMSKNCTEFYLVERQVRESHRRVLSEQRCSMEPHLCVPNGTYCQSSTCTCHKGRYFLVHGSTLCPKARTVKAILYESRTTVFLVHGSTCARRHVLSNRTSCTSRRTTF